MSDELKLKVSLAKKGCNPKKKHPKICINCGIAFIAFHKNKNSFCSGKCLDKYHYKNGRKGDKQRVKNKSRLLEKSSLIGKCNLCGIEYNKIKTMKDLGSTMLNAASVFHKDHIIPLSKGGLNDSNNIRYLCWFCNFSRKDIDIKYDEAIKQSSISFWEIINKTTND